MSETPDHRPGAEAPRPVPSRVARSRLGGLWQALVLGAVVLVLLLVFILMNGQRVQLHLYGAHLNAPLGVALLLAAVLGMLLIAVPGGGRIIQLKRAALRLHKDRELLAATQRDEEVGAPISAGAPPAEPETVAGAAPTEAPRLQSPGEQPPPATE